MFRAFTTNMPDEFQRNEAELAQLVASGDIVPRVGATFTLDEVVQALTLVGDGGAVGKVGIEMAPSRSDTS